MQEGGQVPLSPDTDSDFIGPSPETGLSVSNLLSQLEGIESASPQPDLDFSTINLEGYDFSSIEEPEWYSTIPQTEDELNGWFDQRVQLPPEPSIRMQSPSASEEEVNADIDRYNGWVKNAKQQYSSAESELQDLFEKAKAFESQREEFVENQNRELKRLSREANVDGLRSFFETGNANMLNRQGLRDQRMGFNIPGAGYSDRAVMTFSDLFGGELPSAEAINEMLDRRIEEGATDENFEAALNEHIQKVLSRRAAASQGAEVASAKDIEKIKSDFTEQYVDVFRENEYRKMLGELVIGLLPEELTNNESVLPIEDYEFKRNLKLMETQVFEDLLNDPDARRVSEELGFGRLSTLINIDDDKMYIGEHRPEFDDQIHALTGIGIPRAKLGLAGVAKTIADFGTYLSAGMTPGAPDSYIENSRRILDANQKQYNDYMGVVDRQIADAKSKQNIYAYTRDQVRFQGPLSGYTREEVAGMSLDAQAATINAVNDATTALGGLVDAREFRMGLESLPNSLVGTGLAFVPYVGLGLSTAYIGAGVYQEEYARSFDNPLLKNLTDDERAGYAMWNSLGEAGGELMGNALFLGVGKFVAGGTKLTSGYVLGDDLLRRGTRMLGGYFLATGLAYPEEQLAESLTEFMQLAADDYAEKLSAGKVQNFSEWHQKFNYFEFLQKNEERIKEAGRIGGAMSFIPAAGVTTISYGRAELGRAGVSESLTNEFYERAIAQIVSGQTYTDELSRQERKELEQLTKDISNMSASERMSEKGKADADRLVELTEKASHVGAKAAEDLRGLARTNPRMLAQAYQADMQARELEARGGKYSQDANGQWRLNGRFIKDPTNTKAYAQNQKLSTEEKAKLRERAKMLRDGIKINKIFGRYSNGMRTTDPTLVARRLRQDGALSDWRENSDFQEITSDTDLTGMFSDKDTQKMFEAFQALLTEGESIVVHKENMDSVSGRKGDNGLYLEYSDGRKEVHVRGDLNDAGYVLAHEFGHRNTESILQDPEKRNKISDEVIKNNRILALAVFEAYNGFVPDNLEVELSKLSPEQLANTQREIIVNYMDQAARGNVTNASTGALSGILTDLGIKLGLVSNESLAAISAQHMQVVRAAGLPTGVRTQAQRQSVENIKAEEAKADKMTAEEFEKAVEDGGDLLASRNINLFRGGTVHYEFNRNVKVGDLQGAYQIGYNMQEGQFNDYFHLVNWWRRQTGNGARQTVGNMYFIANGAHVPITPTEKWIKKDKSGTPVRMDGALTFDQIRAKRYLGQQDLRNEFGTQKSNLGQEISRIYRDNFRFNGFSLEKNSFAEPGLDPNSMEGRVAAKKNMLGLIDQGITEDQFREMLGKDRYLITRDTNPELFSLGGNVPYETFTQAAERTTNEALEMGVQPWELLPVKSQGYKQRVESLFGASRQELLDAMNRLEEIREEGNTSFEISALASRNLNWNPETGNNIRLDFLAANESKFFQELQASGVLEIVDDLGQIQSKHPDVKYGRVVTYDRKAAGITNWRIRTKDGKSTEWRPHQSGGPFGPLRSALLGGLNLGPSHYSSRDIGAHRSTARQILDEWYANNPPESTPPDMIVQVALKAETNSLRTSGTFSDFFGWVEKYLSRNPQDLDVVLAKMNSLLAVGNRSSGKHQLQETTAGSEYTRERLHVTYFGEKVVEAYGAEIFLIDGIEVSEDGRTPVITNQNGLMALLVLFQGSGNRKGVDMQGYDIAKRSTVSNVNFDRVQSLGSGTREAILKSFTTQAMAKETDGRWMSTDELLHTINEDSFYEYKNKRFQSKSTGKRTPMPTGTIVMTMIMDPRVVARVDSGADLHKESDKASGELGAFYRNASFPHAVKGLKKVYIARNTTTSQDKYGIDAGSESSISPTLIQQDANSTPLLASRRLPGRIYVEGNSRWEQSAATPYGQQLQLIATRYQDVFSDVLLLQQDVEVFRGSKVPQSQDFEMAMDRYYGMVRNDLEALEATVSDIQKKMRDNGITSQEISDYLYAKHAVERNADIFSKNGMENGSGMTQEEAEEIIDRLESPAMMDVANDVYSIVENTRQTMIDGGLEAKAAVDSWRSRYNHYVPLNGLASDELSDVTNDYPTGGAGMAIYGPSVRRAWGRRSRTEHNILGNIVMQNAATHQRARKDQAMLSLYNLIKENPNDSVWRIISPKKPMIVNGKPVSADKLKSSDNTVPIRVNGEQHFIQFKDSSYAKALNGMTTEKLTQIQRVMSKYVGFLRNSYTVWNPAFFIGNFARDFEMSIINAAAEIEREGGILEGYGLNSKEFASKLTKTVFSTLGALLKEAAFGFMGAKLDPQTQAYMDEWKASGGQTGWGYSESLNRVVAELNEIATRSKSGQTADALGASLRKFYANPKQFFEYVESLNEAFENATRLGAYIEARKAGMTKARAAQLSKNITVNFNKSGEYTAGINSWFLFFNASVQGTSRFARSMRENEMYVEGNQGGTTDKWHNRISTTAKISAGMVLFSAMQTMFNMAMSDVEDDGELYYTKIPDYRKERNWIIMAGPRDPIYIPLPYGLNIFHNMGVILAETGAGKRDPLDAAAFLALSAHSSFSPVAFGQYDDIGQNVTMAMLPSVLKPMVETFVFNKTYFGGQVYKEQSQFGAPVPEYQLSYRSPEYLVKLAEYLNQKSGGTSEVPGDTDINPDKYYYLAQSLTGGAGKFIGDVANLAEGMVAVSRKNLNRAMESEDFVESLLNVEDDEMYRIRRSDIPILKLMYGEASRFYDYDMYKRNRDDINQSMREIKKGSDLDYDIRGVMEMNLVLESTEKSLEKIRDYRKYVYEIEDYVDRKNALEKLSEAERLEYMLFNAAYEEIRSQYKD